MKGTGLTLLVAVGVAVATAASPLPAHGAPLKVQINADKAAIDERFEVTVQVNGRHVRLVVPDTDDFDVTNATDEFSQPMFCMSMGMTVISGPCVYTLQFQPRKAGSLSIPGFQVVDDFWNPGRVLGESRPIQVEVSGTPSGKGQSQGKARVRGGRTRGGGAGGLRGGARQQQDGGPSVPPESAESVARADLQDLTAWSKYDLFLIPRLDRDFVYLNEPFRVDFALYVGDNSGASQLQGLELPELEGFRKEQVDTKDEDAERVNVGGKQYSVHLLARYVLVPLEAGHRSLSPAKAVVLASVSTFRQLQGGFSMTFSSGSQPVDVFSPAVELEVRDLPPGAPAGFSSGNVGNFALSALEVPPPQPAGSWVVLKYQVAGNGNLLSLSPPQLAGDPAIDTRKPYLDTDGVKVDELGMHGKLAVQLPFRLKRPGDFGPPPLRLVFFDPTAGRYSETTLDVPLIQATQPTNDAGEAVEVEPEEIQGIITDGDLEDGRPGARIPTSLVAWGAAFGLALYLAAVLARLVMVSLGRDTARRRMRQAVASARKELDSARKLALGRAPESVYSTLSRCLAVYLEGRFGISVGSATHDRVEQGLVSQDVPVDLAGAVRAELESCEFGRFAPGSLLEKDMLDACARVGDLIKRLDRCKGRAAA